MSHDGERIAALEANAENALRRLDDQDDDLAAIRRDVHEIRSVLANYKGFMSGAAFAIASLAGLVGAGITALWHRLAG